jgi:hypothetical protein
MTTPTQYSRSQVLKHEQAITSMLTAHYAHALFTPQQLKMLEALRTQLQYARKDVQ